jgi:dipeptidyl-peptidase-4
MTLESRKGGAIAGWPVFSVASNRPTAMVLLAVVLASAVGARAQDPPLADPAFIETYAATRGFRLGIPTGIEFTKDGSRVLFLRSGPRSFVQDLYEFDTATGETRQVLSAEAILGGKGEELTAEEKARRERMRSTARGIASYRLSKDSKSILVPLGGRLYVVDRASGGVTELAETPGAPIDARFSPDGTRVACVSNGDLYVHDVVTRTVRRLTSSASSTLTNGLAEFVAQEEMSRFEGYWWSPDGKTLAYQETREEEVELLNIADPYRPEVPPDSFRYPRAGRNNAKVRLGLMPSDGGETRWLSWSQDYPYLATVSWEEHAPLTLVVQNRSQSRAMVLRVDVEETSATTLTSETDAAWLNIDQSVPKWLEGGDGFLWSSEAAGHWQLVRVDEKGTRTALTSPELGYRSLVEVDVKEKVAYVTAATDSLESHLYRVPLDPSAGSPERLTTAPGIHVVKMSGDFRMFVDAYSGRDGTREFRVASIDGRTIGELESVAEQPPFMPKVEWTTAGSEPAYAAVVIRPRDFDPSKKYPVIVRVYGGPGHQEVTASRRSYLLQQWMADHGYVVVSFDGRGTPGRGRAWEREIHGNLIEAPLADQVAALEALGRKVPELDLSRVGITGWSFGGYFSAMAVARRPDVFHAAVAGAPVTDWTDYDTHYTERYIGTPAANKEGYSASSVLESAGNLSRPLLVIHGTADDNVYFLHSLKLSDVLSRAGKAHDFLPLAGQTHVVADPKYALLVQQRTMEFFDRHLRGGGR